jgi:two-component system, cell cycle sensor histidine kinase and response regulator CckA
MSDGEQGRAWLAAIAQASTDAIVGHTPDGAITSWNSAAAVLYGHTSEEALGQPISMFLTSRSVETRQTLVRDPDGNLLGTVTIAPAAAEPLGELRERLEGVALLAGGVAHDFSGLLETIISHSARVHTDLPCDSQAEEDIEAIQRAAKRAAELTRRLLLFSRSGTFDPEPVDLFSFASGLAGRLRLAAGKDVRLEISSCEGLWPVEADRAQLTTALVNLAANAGDAMPYGGELAVDLSNTVLDQELSSLPSGQYVRLEVADSGNGMSDAVLSRAFVPFFTTKSRGDGAGLGLATVYGTVRQAGGDILVESERGTGTSVTIRLPARHQASTAGSGR